MRDMIIPRLVVEFHAIFQLLQYLYECSVTYKLDLLPVFPICSLVMIFIRYNMVGEGNYKRLILATLLNCYAVLSLISSLLQLLLLCSLAIAESVGIILVLQKGYTLFIMELVSAPNCTSFLKCLTEGNSHVCFNFLSFAGSVKRLVKFSLLGLIWTLF
jgi:hypothetical protein